MGAERIAQMHSLLPSAKLIAVVRDPTSRAYSGFQHTCSKGRVFKVNTYLGGSTSSKGRSLLRRELAGRIIIARNKSQAVQGLYIRFGRFAIFEVHLSTVEYPCPPSAFDNFLMIPDTTPEQPLRDVSASQQSPHHLTDEVLDSLLDVRGENVYAFKRSTILTSGLYADALVEYQAKYNADQILILLTEELHANILKVLEKIMTFLGVPYFDYSPFAANNSRGNIYASFQLSKMNVGADGGIHYLPMSDRAKRALDKFYAKPNLKLVKLLGDDRVNTLWKRNPFTEY